MEYTARRLKEQELVAGVEDLTLDPCSEDGGNSHAFPDPPSIAQAYSRLLGNQELGCLHKDVRFGIRLDGRGDLGQQGFRLVHEVSFRRLPAHPRRIHPFRAS